MYQDMMDNIGCVAAQDEELAAAMNRELARQRRNIELIASENIVLSLIHIYFFASMSEVR